MPSSNLKRLTFVVTFTTLCEVHLVALSVYLCSLLRGCIPSFTVPIVSSCEKSIAAVYSIVRERTTELGMHLLFFVDQKVDGSIKWFFDIPWISKVLKTAREMYEICTAVAARVAELWQKHGIILGTFAAVIAALTALKDWLRDKLSGPSMKAFIQTVVKTSTFQRITTSLQSNALPYVSAVGNFMTQTFQAARESFSVPMEKGIEWLSTGVDTIVATVYYAHFVERLSEIVKSIRSTEVYKNLETRLEPYVSPTLEKITDTDLFHFCIEKMTPVKEE